MNGTILSYDLMVFSTQTMTLAGRRRKREDERKLALSNSRGLDHSTIPPGLGFGVYRGTSLIRTPPSPLGSPKDPRYSPTVGPFGEAVSYERATPVATFQEDLTTAPSHQVWGLGFTAVPRS